MFTFNHFNFNVLDLARSVQFYHDALGLEPVRPPSRKARMIHPSF